MLPDPQLARGRVRPIGAPLAGCLTVTLLLAGSLAPTSAAAGCAQWNLNGRWVLSQTNGYRTELDLRQAPGGGIIGQASYGDTHKDTGVGTHFGLGGNGPVSGKIVGNKLTLVAEWTDGSTGEYIGEVGAEGQLTGITRDQKNRKNAAIWHEWNGKRAVCAVSDQPTRTPPSSANPAYRPGVDLPGSDYRSFQTLKGAEAECSIACSNEPKCQSWTWTKPGIQLPKGKCWLKHAVPTAVSNDCCISGTRSRVIGAEGKPGKVIGARSVATARNDVDVHEGPGGNFPVIGMMRANAKGAVLEKHADGWCRLDLGNGSPRFGWVAEDHLRLPKNQNCRP